MTPAITWREGSMPERTVLLVCYFILITAALLGSLYALSLGWIETVVFVILSILTIALAEYEAEHFLKPKTARNGEKTG
jgi:hypothetical protein